VAIAALQLFFDRGQLKDWFGSTEIWIEASVALVALYLFIIHMLTTREHPFVSPALFKDRNFVTGNVFMFVIGAILFANLALLPPLLQGLFNYPVVTTGLVTAPRGMGTIISMLVVGRLIGKVDTRFIIGAGFVVTTTSLWQMTGFDLQMDYTKVVWSGVLQGIGVGLIYVPLAAAAFATLPPALRNEGTAMFSLIRNIGSSIGISVVNILLTRNSQIMHAVLGEHVNPYNPVLRAQLPAGAPSLRMLAGLNATVTEQAAMIAYNNDFKLMMLLSMAAMPLVLLMRKGGGGKVEPVHVE
jgi:MFS transporter, DHA2 family, multidrug resistance protein